MKEYKVFLWTKEPDGTLSTVLRCASVLPPGSGGLVLKARILKVGDFYEMHFAGQTTVLLFAHTVRDAKRIATTLLFDKGGVPRRPNPVR